MSISARDGLTEFTEDDSNKYERRREQIRRAQRSHRDRKATYVAALEQEVAELRAENAIYREGKDREYGAENIKVKALEREVAELRAERAAHVGDCTILKKLRSFLQDHDTGLPPGIPELPPDIRKDERSRLMAIAELSCNHSQGQSISAHLPPLDPGFSPTERVRARDVASAPGLPTNFPNEDCLMQNVASGQCSTEDRLPASTSPSHNDKLVCEDGFGGKQTAIGFVLALEKPCLYHHHLSSPDPLIQGQLGTGHRQMLSSPIMARLSSVAVDPRNINLPDGFQWDVPAAELDNLLSLARNLNLMNEQTPIQIWQRLYCHPQFASLTQGKLRQLQSDLFPLVKCYGFGAAVTDGELEEVFNVHFGTDRDVV